MKDGGGRNESVVNNFERPQSDGDEKFTIKTKNRLAYLAEQSYKVDEE